jgi:hypothetical protein
VPNKRTITQRPFDLKLTFSFFYVLAILANDGFSKRKRLGNEKKCTLHCGLAHVPIWFEVILKVVVHSR